jgi:hypothetical protein
MVPDYNPDSWQGWSFLYGKNPHAPRNFYLAVAVQAGHFKIELIPGEFRVTSYQGLKVTFRGASEKFEDSISDGFLLRHQAFLLPITNFYIRCFYNEILQELSEKNRHAPRMLEEIRRPRCHVGGVYRGVRCGER